MSGAARRPAGSRQAPVRSGPRPGPVPFPIRAARRAAPSARPSRHHRASPAPAACSSSRVVNSTSRHPEPAPSRFASASSHTRHSQAEGQITSTGGSPSVPQSRSTCALAANHPASLLRRCTSGAAARSQATRNGAWSGTRAEAAVALGARKPPALGPGQDKRERSRVGKLSDTRALEIVGEVGGEAIHAGGDLKAGHAPREIARADRDGARERGEIPSARGRQGRHRLVPQDGEPPWFQLRRGGRDGLDPPLRSKQVDERRSLLVHAEQPGQLRSPHSVSRATHSRDRARRAASSRMVASVTVAAARRPRGPPTLGPLRSAR